MLVGFHFHGCLGGKSHWYVLRTPYSEMAFMSKLCLGIRGCQGLGSFTDRPHCQPFHPLHLVGICMAERLRTFLVCFAHFRVCLSHRLVSIGWISALLLELTSFGVIHALHINPAHFSNAARQLLLAAQGAQAVPEWYEYVRGNTSRIGHNCWLLYMIASLEIVLAIRYGKGGKSYGPFVIPVDILWIMGAFVSLWCLWMAVTYYKNRIGRPLSSKWSLALRVFAYSPLVFLARRWAY